MGALSLRLIAFIALLLLVEPLVAGEPAAALDSLRAAVQREPNNASAVLRLSQELGERIGDAKPPAAAKQLAEEALSHAKRAAELAPANAKARLNLAISYGRLTDFVGNKAKLELSRLIHDEALQASALDPTDDLAWSVLGRWHYGLANVNGVLKALAGAMYGSLPKASNAQATAFLLKAATLAPQRISHHADLARAYEALGQIDLARPQWQTVIDLPAADQDDEREKKEARRFLGKTKAAAPR